MQRSFPEHCPSRFRRCWGTLSLELWIWVICISFSFLSCPATANSTIRHHHSAETSEGLDKISKTPHAELRRDEQHASENIRGLNVAFPPSAFTNLPSSLFTALSLPSSIFTALPSSLFTDITVISPSTTVSARASASNGARPSSRKSVTAKNTRRPANTRVIVSSKSRSSATRRTGIAVTQTSSTTSHPTASHPRATTSNSSQTQAVAPAKASSEHSSGSNNHLDIILPIVLGVLAIAAVLAFFYWRKRRQQQRETEEAAAATFDEETISWDSDFDQSTPRTAPTAPVSGPLPTIETPPQITGFGGAVSDEPSSRTSYEGIAQTAQIAQAPRDVESTRNTTTAAPTPGQWASSRGVTELQYPRNTADPRNLRSTEMTETSLPPLYGQWLSSRMRTSQPGRFHPATAGSDAPVARSQQQGGQSSQFRIARRPVPSQRRGM